MEKNETQAEFRARLFGKSGKWRGNLDGSLILKNEHETRLYWVRLENSEALQKAGQKQFIIKAFIPIQWEAFERNEARNGVCWWSQLGHFKSMELLHDPRLIKDISKLETVK